MLRMPLLLWLDAEPVGICCIVARTYKRNNSHLVEFATTKNFCDTRDKSKYFFIFYVSFLVN